MTTSVDDVREVAFVVGNVVKTGGDVVVLASLELLPGLAYNLEGRYVLCDESNGASAAGVVEVATNFVIGSKPVIEGATEDRRFGNPLLKAASVEWVINGTDLELQLTGIGGVFIDASASVKGVGTGKALL